jgi:hypothetical protein
MLVGTWKKEMQLGKPRNFWENNTETGFIEKARIWRGFKWRRITTRGGLFSALVKTALYQIRGLLWLREWQLLSKRELRCMEPVAVRLETGRSIALSLTGNARDSCMLPRVLYTASHWLGGGGGSLFHVSIRKTVDCGKHAQYASMLHVSFSFR